MSIVPIDVGQEPNDETGDPLRDGGIKINANFAELDVRTAAAQAKADRGVFDAAAAKAVADAAIPAAALGDSVPQLINGTVPASQLPSFVDDVLEFPTLGNFPAAGETGKIYIAVNDGDSPTNPTRQYRWSGSAFVLIPSSPGSTDQVPEGPTNQYFTAARVRSTTLSGLGALVNAAILATDTALQAFAKLQGQLNAKLGKSEVAADSEKLGGQLATFYTTTMVGASASVAGMKGLVPPPAAGDQGKFLAGDGTYKDIAGSVTALSGQVAAQGSRIDALETKVSALEARQRSLGDGQNWGVYTGNRTAGTTYTNNTGRSIAVQIQWIQGGAGAVALVIAAPNGGAVDIAWGSQSNVAGGNTVLAIVPAGYTYSLTNNSGSVIRAWLELR
ncbi:hypothetical protein [Pseudomonas saponiphila]|uniref:hypothetical protein n=1 Tax=Pseudomonas saponiphila TaxID=556534 RepID=UPI002240C637|nr:hypothetical protein [Pseudomonas saponiphila]